MTQTAWQIRRIGWSLGLVMLAWTVLAGCSSEPGAKPPAASIPGDGPTSDSVGESGTVEPVQLTADGASQESPAATTVELHPEVLIATSLGEIRVRLDAEKAPRTVESFLLNYVDPGFYSQTVFHYVDRGFMIAGGGYTAELQPKETRTTVMNESHNGRKNVRGAVAMAHHPDYFHSSTSQFFINLADNPSLDYAEDEQGNEQGYCVFGEVVAGMDVVDRIAAVDVQDRDEFPKTPVRPVMIEAVRRVR